MWHKRVLVILPIVAGILTAWLIFARAAVPARRVIVLGIDGMDPKLLRDYMARGEMPNFARLARQGGFTELATTFPPQSPVAWSTLATGSEPGATGIFDFIHRDPATLTPYLSTSVIDPPRFELPIGQWLLPLTSPRPRLLREGKAFWQVLDDSGIDAVILKMPANFPTGADARSHPRRHGHSGSARRLRHVFLLHRRSLPAGRRCQRRTHLSRQRRWRDGHHNAQRSAKSIPARSQDRHTSFTVSIDRTAAAALIEIQGRRTLLRQGEWSEWVPLSFDLIPHLQSASAMCRFYLKEAHPAFRLYVSPLNLDPMNPPLPISTPASYAAELARETGRFYTQGIAEDTKALSSGVLREDEFLAQARIVMREQVRLFGAQVARFRSGVFFYYFSSLDENAHMTWRQPGQPVIEDLYREMDRALGTALAATDVNTTLLVASDHGFTQFARAFNLNAWLAQHDYLVTRQSAGEFPENIDWAKTRVYGLGLNAVYVNQKGREAHGTVAAGAETAALLDRLRTELLGVRDPVSGEPVFTRIGTGHELYGDAHRASRPDLVLGYNRGYRAGWETVLGGAAGAVLEDNNNAWSGDHCIDPAFVPGVLLANRPITGAHPRLADVASTILRQFDLAPPPGMRGEGLLAESGRKHVRQ